MARRRPTVAEARIKRHMHRAARRNQVAQRTAARAAHRDERHTIGSHLRNMGADDTTATGIAASLRKKTTPGVKGYALKDGTRRKCTRYTRAQVLIALAAYKPRKTEYKTARAHLLDLAA
ncbi:hypothetical protein [Nocardiopsis lucentensis]|uniref:hypothetical protein n=1 Tax=Nocardiopsis lucentensis TaxID=53441 RepID=UPI0003454D9B|nr:hypothetical protein [Nocardiopsis lucentensis]